MYQNDTLKHKNVCSVKNITNKYTPTASEQQLYHKHGSSLLSMCQNILPVPSRTLSAGSHNHNKGTQHPDEMSASYINHTLSMY